jgi:hypothetical protein
MRRQAESNQKVLMPLDQPGKNPHELIDGDRELSRVQFYTTADHHLLEQLKSSTKQKLYKRVHQVGY